MESYTTFVGLDVDKDSIQVAMLRPQRREALEWSMRNDARAAGRLVRKLHKQGTGQIVCCYEAGPCGYGFQRQMSDLGVRCIVVAPSPEQEALRDLCRARIDAKQDLMRSRHRLSKMLLGRSLHYSAAKKNWTRAHRVWLRSLAFLYPSEQAVFDDYLRAVEQLEERIKGLDEKLEAASQCEPYAGPVGRLRCFRGIDTVTAVTIVADPPDAASCDVTRCSRSERRAGCGVIQCLNEGGPSARPH